MWLLFSAHAGTIQACEVKYGPDDPFVGVLLVGFGADEAEARRAAQRTARWAYGREVVPGDCKAVDVGGSEAAWREVTVTRTEPAVALEAARRRACFPLHVGEADLECMASNRWTASSTSVTPTPGEHVCTVYGRTNTAIATGTGPSLAVAEEDAISNALTRMELRDFPAGDLGERGMVSCSKDGVDVVRPDVPDRSTADKAHALLVKAVETGDGDLMQYIFPLGRKAEARRDFERLKGSDPAKQAEFLAMVQGVALGAEWVMSVDKTKAVPKARAQMAKVQLLKIQQHIQIHIIRNRVPPEASRGSGEHTPDGSLGQPLGLRGRRNRLLHPLPRPRWRAQRRRRSRRVAAIIWSHRTDEPGLSLAGRLHLVDTPCLCGILRGLP